MAAEAEQNSADFRAAAGDAGGQGFGVLAAVAESDGLAIQWAGVLSPQCVAAGIGGAAVTGTERAAVRGMAARAAAALIVVRAEYVHC